MSGQQRSVRLLDLRLHLMKPHPLVCSAAVMQACLPARSMLSGQRGGAGATGCMGRHAG